MGLVSASLIDAAAVSVLSPSKLLLPVKKIKMFFDGAKVINFFVTL